MKTVIHLCADIGSDSYPYARDPDYEVILVGKDIGVENYHPPNKPIHLIIANPVCTTFSTARGFHLKGTPDLRTFHHCERIIQEADIINHYHEAPKLLWVIENPAMGTMKEYLGKPDYVYQPWEFGSPWTKRTALWGNFNHPRKLYDNWHKVEKNDKLYVRPGRPKPSLAFLHKSAIYDIFEFRHFVDYVETDADFRSLCSQKFAYSFYRANR